MYFGEQQMANASTKAQDNAAAKSCRGGAKRVGAAVGEATAVAKPEGAAPLAMVLLAPLADVEPTWKKVMDNKAIMAAMKAGMWLVAEKEHETGIERAVDRTFWGAQRLDC